MTDALKPGATIGILGGGQLGRMLSVAAELILCARLSAVLAAAAAAGVAAAPVAAARHHQRIILHTRHAHRCHMA